MELTQLILAGVVLLVGLGVGTVAHELSHAITLRLLGVDCQIEWLPRRDAAGFDLARGALASVTVRTSHHEPDAWRLRVAALMPLTLAIPIPLILLGILPDPVASGDLVLTMATIGWLACGIPSPQDFSLLWYAEAAIEQNAI